MLILSLLQSESPLISLIGFALAILLGIGFHEYAHALAAWKAGDPTAKIEGRLTLNPFAHFDPIGTIFLFLVGFGWGKPVPVNPRNFHRKSDELKVAIAGVLTNILIALIFAIPIKFALTNGQLIDSSSILQIFSMIVGLNITLAVFNLIPLAPLDGSHFIEYFLNEAAKETYQIYSQYALLAIVILDRVSGIPILWAIIEEPIRILSILIAGKFPLL